MGGLDRRLVRASRAARAHLVAAAVLGCIAAALIVAQAALLATVIDRAAMHGAAVGALAGTLVALAAVTAGRSLVTAAFELAGRLGAAAVMRDLRGRLARHLLLVRPARQSTERTGELAATTVQGVDALEAYFAGYLPQLVLAATVPLVVLVWTARLAPVPAAILAVTVPVLVGFMVLIGLRARASTTARWHALTLLSAHFLDVVRGLPTLRAFGREHAQAQQMEAVGEAYRAETMATLRVAFLSALVLELCAMVGTALVAATIGIALAGGHLDLRTGLTVLVLAPELYAPLRGVGQQFHAAADGTAAAERVLDALAEPAAVAVPATPLPAPDPAAAPLRLERVRFAHPGRLEILRGVDLELVPGAITALVGDSGAGKTTLAALVLRLADPSAGRVRCGTTDLRDLDPAAWHRRIAWVPQHPRLYASTIAENIALSAPGADERRIRDAATAAGVLDAIEALPDGLATRVGDGGRRLSAGQAHRVALARAFLSDAPLLVLDEPTAHLDAATARAIGDALLRVTRGRTTLLITHDGELAARADRVVELSGGRARLRPVSARPALEVA